MCGDFVVRIVVVVDSIVCGGCGVGMDGYYVCVREFKYGVLWFCGDLMCISCWYG